jgi:hypothetical protein
LLWHLDVRIAIAVDRHAGPNPDVHVSTGVAYSNGGNQSVGGSFISAKATVMADGTAYGVEGGVTNGRMPAVAGTIVAGTIVAGPAA